MAWIRTCLSLIGFGFGIDQIVTVIYEETGDAYLNPLRLSRFLGLSFIALVTLVLIKASIDYRQELKPICRDGYLYTLRISQAPTVAVIMAIL